MNYDNKGDIKRSGITYALHKIGKQRTCILKYKTYILKTSYVSTSSRFIW